MSANLQQFKQDLRKERNYLTQQIENKIKDLVVNVFNALLEPSPLGTPVISGWLKSNWRIGVNDYERQPVGSKDSVTTAPQAASLSEFLNADFEQMNTIYIYNQVPYTTNVNEGNAKQSPVLFIELSIDRGLRKSGVAING